MTNDIEKRIELKAPVSRVWRAITDYREFGEWFKVKLEGPFVAGKVSRGQITHPCIEHATNAEAGNCQGDTTKPGRSFSLTWHHYATHDPNGDYSTKRVTLATLVEFRLEKIPSGTLLVITESGFDKIPAHRRAEALRMDDGGWAGQIKNIEKHVAQNA